MCRCERHCTCGRTGASRARWRAHTRAAASACGGDRKRSVHCFAHRCVQSELSCSVCSPLSAQVAMCGRSTAPATTLAADARHPQPMRDPRSRCATPAADMPRVGCARAALLLGPLSLALPVARTPRRSDPRRTDPRRSDPWTPIHRRRGYIKYRDVSGRCIDNHLPVRPDTEGNRYIFLIQCISDTVDTAIHGDTAYRMYHHPSGQLSVA